MSTLESRRYVDQRDVDDALELPDSFVSSNDLIGVTWGIGPVLTTRDSGYLERANAKSLLKHLNGDESLKGDWDTQRAGHWACGWCEHVIYKVWTPLDPAAGDAKENRAPTRIMQILLDWQDMLQEHGCADDAMVAEERREEIEEYVGNAHLRGLKDDLPADWILKLADELERRNAVQDETSGDIYISDEDFKAAIVALGFQEAEDA